jgi:hypothetical protein
MPISSKNFCRMGPLKACIYKQRNFFEEWVPPFFIWCFVTYSNFLQVVKKRNGNDCELIEAWITGSHARTFYHISHWKAHRQLFLLLLVNVCFRGLERTSVWEKKNDLMRKLTFKRQILSSSVHCCMHRRAAGLPDFSRSKHSKMGKYMYQMTTNYTKRP